ncbi:RNA polymerase sigma factor [Paenibacillus assamensis]|uniref:RNA polymerase sigma factor n=1 Tax=Paenibacillus assamensis TaxID=311244 RepID=UPI0004075EF3|nr:sigma-70 family RNA polymerase sigma factor [Paenibacillus assamensis]
MAHLIPGEKDSKQHIEWLVEQVKAGDHQAYGDIIRHFEKQIYQYCCYLLKNREEAEDVLQEIFIIAYDKIEQYEQQTSFSAWLNKIAYHHSLNVMKKRSRWNRLFSRYKQEVVLRPTYANHHEQMIDEMLECLSIEERHVLLLKAVEQYNFNEIADIMDSNPAAIRKRYERIRKKLISANKEAAMNGALVESG